MKEVKDEILGAKDAEDQELYRVFVGVKNKGRRMKYFRVWAGSHQHAQHKGCKLTGHPTDVLLALPARSILDVTATL